MNALQYLPKNVPCPVLAIFSIARAGNLSAQPALFMGSRTYFSVTKGPVFFELYPENPCQTYAKNFRHRTLPPWLTAASGQQSQTAKAKITIRWVRPAVAFECCRCLQPPSAAPVLPPPGAGKYTAATHPSAPALPLLPEFQAARQKKPGLSTCQPCLPLTSPPPPSQPAHRQIFLKIR